MDIFEGIFMFHNLKALGLSVSEIARQSGCDRKTVRKYLSTEPDDPQTR